MVLATQAVDDLASATLLRTVVESCPTTLFLANPALDRQQYADLFRLNAVQLEQLAALTPRRQLLLKRDQMSKVLTLDVDEASYWLYTNTPMDYAQPEPDGPPLHRQASAGDEPRWSKKGVPPCARD